MSCDFCGTTPAEVVHHLDEEKTSFSIYGKGTVFASWISFCQQCEALYREGDDEALVARQARWEETDPEDVEACSLIDPSPSARGVDSSLPLEAARPKAQIGSAACERSLSKKAAPTLTCCSSDLSRSCRYPHPGRATWPSTEQRHAPSDSSLRDQTARIPG